MANERVSLAEEALKLVSLEWVSIPLLFWWFRQVDRHLLRLQRDLDKHDQDHPEYAPELALPTRSYTIPHGRKSMVCFVCLELRTNIATEYSVGILADLDDYQGEEDDEDDIEDEDEEAEDLDQDEDEQHQEEKEQEQVVHKPIKLVAEDKIEPKPITVVHTPPVKVDPDIQAIMANRNQKRKKKEARESDKGEPLYCFCQQVSYGEMVACDGEVK